LAVGVWAVIFLVITLRCGLAPHRHSVYPIFATAAQNWLAGNSLYGMPGDPYRYSPLVATLFVPFSLLPAALGGVLWRWLSGAVYLTALAWWCRAVAPQPLTSRRLAWIGLLIVPLSIGNLNNGQSNVLVLGLLLAGTASAARERWNLAAGSVALACLFKIYPIAIGLLLVVVYGRRLALRLGLALAVGLLVPFLLQQPDYVAAQYAGWLEHLRTDDRQTMPVELWYRDIRLLCHTLHLPLNAIAYPVAQVMTGCAIAGLCWLGRRQRRDAHLVLHSLFALGCCWMTLFGSATESSTYVLLAPSLAWAVTEAWSRPTAGLSPATQGRGTQTSLWQLLGLSASFGLFVVTQAAVWLPHSRPLHTLGSHALAGLLFLLCQLARDIRELIVPVPLPVSNTSSLRAA
jgi:hypothetical protein